MRVQEGRAKPLKSVAVDRFGALFAVSNRFRPGLWTICFLKLRAWGVSRKTPNAILPQRTGLMSGAQRQGPLTSALCGFLLGGLCGL